MRLNAQTDFSLRILMYLAVKDGELATIKEIASRLELSHAHLMRIVAKLAALGFVHAARGRSGGLTLARDPDFISVEEVVSAIEPDFALVQCSRGQSTRPCSIEPACVLKGVLSSASKAFLAELRAVSLGDLTRPNRAQLTEMFRFVGADSAMNRRTRSGDMHRLRVEAGGRC